MTITDKYTRLGVQLISKEAKYLAVTETVRNFPKVVKRSDTLSNSALQFQLAYPLLSSWRCQSLIIRILVGVHLK